MGSDDELEQAALDALRCVIATMVTDVRSRDELFNFLDNVFKGENSIHSSIEILGYDGLAELIAHFPFNLIIWFCCNSEKEKYFHRPYC